MIAGAGAFVTWKLAHDFSHPEVQVSKELRGSLNYVNNSLSADDAKKWSDSTFHRGPEFVQDMKIQVKKA